MLMKTPLLFCCMCLLPLFSCQSTSSDSGDQLDSELDFFNQKNIIDLTHDYSDETVYWVTAREFELDTVAYGDTENGYFYSAFNISTAEHGGTHIDAPIHFAKGKQTVDEIPLEKLMGNAIKVNVTAKVTDNPDYQISVQDFENWEDEQNMQIPEGSIVLIETGFSAYYPDKIKYLGTDKRGEEALDQMHFPGISPEAATWLVENRNINAIGLDTPSIDYGQSKDFESHVILLSHNIPGFENLANLDKLPDKDFMVIALPMKIKGGSGAPLRIVGVINP